MGQGSLPLSTVRRIGELYRERPSYSHVARRLGIHRSTVKRYVTRGCPNRAVPAVLDAGAAAAPELEVPYTQSEHRAKQRHLLRRLGLAADLALDRLLDELSSPSGRCPVRLTDVSKTLELMGKLSAQRDLWVDAPQSAGAVAPDDPASAYPELVSWCQDNYGRNPTPADVAQFEQECAAVEAEINAERAARDAELDLPPPDRTRH